MRMHSTCVHPACQKMECEWSAQEPAASSKVAGASASFQRGLHINPSVLSVMHQPERAALLLAEAMLRATVHTRQPHGRAAEAPGGCCPPRRRRAWASRSSWTCCSAPGRSPA